MNHDILYLGSQSKPRQDLLKIAGIDFKVLQHKSSESVVQPSDDFEKYVIAIACDKMQHLQLPEISQIKEDTLLSQQNKFRQPASGELVEEAKPASGELVEEAKPARPELVEEAKPAIGELVEEAKPARPELVEGSPVGRRADKIFVLTADTLIKLINSNQILGKPKDKQDAKNMLRLMQAQPVHVLTGCCLQVMIKTESASQKPVWQVQKQSCWATGAVCEFIVDEQSMDQYFEKEPWAMHACGAGVIEGFGQVFLKSINGSYSAVLGLPLFELRHKLLELGFKFYLT